jgi:GNAT superfamily N-acetyltransferase
MNQITYRRAVAEDAATLADLRLRFALELSGEQPEAMRAALRKQLAGFFLKATSDNTCISILAEYDGEVVGIGTVHLRDMAGNFRNPTGKWGYIMNMYTVPEFRKKGICSEILNQLIIEARKAGTTAFELHATAEGAPVYLKGGFMIHNEPTLRKFVP